MEAQPYAAMISSMGYSKGFGFEQELHIDATGFLPASTVPSGGTAWLYNDRVVAHELVHAVTNVSMNVRTFPTWFDEGLAELIHGGDERLVFNLSRFSAEEIVNTITAGGWNGTSAAYSAAYVALRMMHYNIKLTGGQGIIDLTKKLDISDYYLTPQPSSATLFRALTTLSEALASVTSNILYRSEWEFMSYFKSYGPAMIRSWVATGALNNQDTGAIGGYDADRKDIKSAESVISDKLNPIPLYHSDNDTKNGFPFSVIWPAAEKIGMINILAVCTKDTMESRYSRTLISYDVYRNADS